jgi:hypothetical protein
VAAAAVDQIELHLPLVVQVVVPTVHMHLLRQQV